MEGVFIALGFVVVTSMSRAFAPFAMPYVGWNPIRWIAVWIWNFAEVLRIDLGRFGPFIFGVCIRAGRRKVQ